SQVLRRRQQFDLISRVVEILPPASRSDDARDSVHASFPSFMEDRLVPFMNDRTHAVHAAPVVHTVHFAPSACGSVTFGGPTLAPRVTSAASASSLMFSLPPGRSGSTR